MKPEALPKRAKPRSPAKKAVATGPVVERVCPNTLGTVKKNHPTVIRNDPRKINPQLTHEQIKAEAIVVAPDVLSLSAQLAPWIYMSSTLEVALQGSETRLKVRRSPFSTVRVPTMLLTRKR